MFLPLQSLSLQTNYFTMQKIEDILKARVSEAFLSLYKNSVSIDQIQIQKTKKEFEGDFTLVVFPLLRFSGKKPEETATELGNYITRNSPVVNGYNVIKGFLNLLISPDYWKEFLQNLASDYFETSYNNINTTVMVEFSSPNTNKPLHLGHIRNNLLGYSISRIIEATGKKVIKVNLVNDRGIHICKSMLAWQKWGKGEEPTEEKKGDKLVGEYYVKFDQEYKKELAELQKSGLSKEEAENKSVLMQEARNMLLQWENDDKEVRVLWEKMNAWVYKGFDITYKRMGVEFDKIYYESETYKLGKSLVETGLKENHLERKEDGSVWADLTADGLDSKLLLRSDGTSVYMTQDLGTAKERFDGYQFDQHIYVVGNEQNYHFQVLKLILKKLGYDWSDNIYHLSYGMVELPEGKMKSREGTVVDADDLMDEMIKTAGEMSDEMGKLSAIGELEKEKIFIQVGLAALKYFILKVDPRKNMTFNPQESIDFNGNTGPFIQYSYARIQSILRKAKLENIQLPSGADLGEKEINLIKLVYDFPSVIEASANELNPSLIANYMYEVAKEYNQFYHDHSILKAETEVLKNTRLFLSEVIAKTIYRGMFLLGIEVPERM
jgi:arginyl-tRNA synthetase